MPIQVYVCKTHDKQDVYFRTYDVKSEYPCPECGKMSKHVISAPGVVDIKLTWNDKANDYRRDPYTQAKAQMRNLDRSEQERNGAAPMKVTEEQLQVVAKRIDAGNKTKTKSVVEKTHDRLRRNKQKSK